VEERFSHKPRTLASLLPLTATWYQKVETYQMKEVKRAMLSKIAGQLNHLEKTHFNTINDLTAEVKAVKQALESAKSKFIGFE
jgi:hypothetical protein